MGLEETGLGGAQMVHRWGVVDCLGTSAWEP